MKERFEIRPNSVDTTGKRTFSMWSNQRTGAFCTGTWDECEMKLIELEISTEE